MDHRVNVVYRGIIKSAHMLDSSQCENLIVSCCNSNRIVTYWAIEKFKSLNNI